jgi:heat shock protein HtpX
MRRLTSFIGAGATMPMIIFLLMSMGALLSLCGWIVAGWDGIVWSIFAGAVALALMRRVPVEVFLNSMNARPLQAKDALRLRAIFAALCQHAGLAPIPRLYCIEEAIPLAFSLGKGESAAVVVADSLLAGLTPRELSGILAHEIIHLRSGDITLKQLGFVLSWLTRMLSQLGFIFLFVGLLLHVFSLAEFPLLSLFVLAGAPLAVNLLQLALSRVREAEADLDAAELTGDPAGLASALVKLRQWQESLLRELFPTGRILHLPTLLTDHPPTEERIRRLNHLAESG